MKFTQSMINISYLSKALGIKPEEVIRDFEIDKISFNGGVLCVNDLKCKKQESR